jgi:hypothetical protein
MLLAISHPVVPADNLPHIIIWSWESDENLKWLDPNKVGVAYLAGTIVLCRETAVFKRRRNRLIIPEAVKRFPVFRIENAYRHNLPTEAAIRSAVDLIVTHSEPDRCAQIQIDFDAPERERKAYLTLLQAIKRRLPPNCALSMTALASWCLDDKWLRTAPVNETVAMAFCMGSGKAEVLSAMKHEQLDSGASCRQSLGIALCETDTYQQLQELGYIKRCDHLYVFSPLGWNKRRYEQLLAELDHK